MYVSGGYIRIWFAANSQTSSSCVPLNTWTQVAATWSGVTGTPASFYANGVFDSNSSNVQYTIGYTSGRPFIIGEDPRDYSGISFNGIVDNILIFNTQLSGDQVAIWYVAAPPPSQTELDYERKFRGVGRGTFRGLA